MLQLSFPLSTLVDLHGSHSRDYGLSGSFAGNACTLPFLLYFLFCFSCAQTQRPTKEVNSTDDDVRDIPPSEN